MNPTRFICNMSSTYTKKNRDKSIPAFRIMPSMPTELLNFFSRMALSDPKMMSMIISTMTSLNIWDSPRVSSAGLIKCSIGESFLLSDSQQVVCDSGAIKLNCCNPSIRICLRCVIAFSIDIKGFPIAASFRESSRMAKCR